MNKFTDRKRKASRFARSTTTWHLENDGAPSLYGWVALQMSKGALYAAILFFGIIGFIVILRVISSLLPEDPYAALEGIAPFLTAVG